ncbi:MAG: DUF3857 domain-containing protein [Bacteroidota bacterium]
MLKRIVLFITMLSSLNGFCQAQGNYNADLIPANLKSRATAVIRDMATTVDMRAPENVILTVRKAVTILNSNGTDRAALTIQYDKSTSIKYVKGLILDASGTPAGKFTLNNFIDESAVSSFSLFEDSRVKHYLPNMINYPYTVIYEYEIRYKQNLIIPDWYANRYTDLSVEKSTYTFICKPEDKIRIKEYNYKGNSDVVKSDKLFSQTWKVSNLPAIKYEPYAPDPDQFLTYVKITAEKFSYYGHSGIYKNWEELGKWVYEDLLKSRQYLSPAAETEVKNLVNGLDNDKDKIKKIYEFVQKKTRYISVQVGIGGFQPFPAMDVDRLSYGDCKALVNYTQSLLKAAGIYSEYCVVYAGSTKSNMDPDFASMDQGNHIILCVPLKSDTTWLECTSQDNPCGYLGTFTDDRTVLACTPNGGKLLHTPVLKTTDNSLQRKAILTLDALGDLTGNLQTILKGSQYDNYIRLVNEPYAEQLKLLKKEYDIDNINFKNFKLTQKKDGDPTTTEKLELTIPSYAPKTDSRVYLIPNLFNKSSIIPEVRTRTLPVYINRGFTDEDEVVYHIPEKYTLEVKLEDKVITSPFGSYRVSIKQQGPQLVYSRKMVLNNGNYPAESYEALVAFFNNISSYDHTKIVLKAN